MRRCTGPDSCVRRIRGTVKTHAAEGMDMPVLCDSLEDAYVKSLSKFACKMDAGRSSED